jgi:Fe-S cluster assembly protein SufD
MDTNNFFTEHYNKLQSLAGNGNLQTLRQKAFHSFNEKGIPLGRNEEWKYTRISNLFNKQYTFPLQLTSISEQDLKQVRLPGYEKANELVFVNGLFSEGLSTIRSEALKVQPLEIAALGEFSKIISDHLGHSSDYLKDGINALNTAFVHGGVFIYVNKGKTLEHPIYLYNITDSRSANIFSQPRSLVYLSENASAQIVETFSTLGAGESFTNGVMEIVVEQDAMLEHYKIQNDAAHSNQVSTTHIRQIGKSYVHTVTISLNGGIVRNNLNVVLEAEHCETHLYGLYFIGGDTHVDNHTLVDNVTPHSFSNEFYKGIIDDNATGIFNGKIMVQPLAQKTNAYQSNKNILLSDSASVNTKPQLEIFADDVKCSHGCTVGQLDEEGMFYLRSRGIREEKARSLLVHAFAMDVLEHIKPIAIRSFVDHLISERLES